MHTHTHKQTHTRTHTHTLTNRHICTHSQTHSQTHTHTHTHTLIYTHTHTHIHTHTHKLSHTHTHTLSLSLSLTHTLTNSHTHSLSHTHTHSQTLTHTLSLTHSHTHTRTHKLSHTHTHTHTLTNSHTHSLSLSLSHTPFQKLGSNTFFNELNTFINQGRIKLIKIDSKGIYNLTKDFISNKCCSFELSIHQRFHNTFTHKTVNLNSNNISLFLLYFWSNKCILGETSFNNFLPTPNFWTLLVSQSAIKQFVNYHVFVWCVQMSVVCSRANSAVIHVTDQIQIIWTWCNPSQTLTEIINTHMNVMWWLHTHKHTLIKCGLWGLSIGVMVFILYKLYILST